MQEKQLDIHVRYWESNQEAVVTRYLGSQFMGHAKADDLVQAIKAEITDQLNVRDMLQINMNGLSVNIKLLKIFKEEIERDFGHLLLEIGSCGLHTMHNAFKFSDSTTGWNVCQTLRAMYDLFKDSPAPREDYMSCGDGSSKMLPLKYVSHRWLENLPVCKRAMEIWLYIIKYIEKIKAKKFTKPTCKSYQTLMSAYGDKFFLAKLGFFCSVAPVVQPFLKNFQSDKPLTPFLVKELADILKTLLRRVFKSDLVDAADTYEKISRFDLDEGHLQNSKIIIGIATEERIKNVKGASDKQYVEFRMECREFIIGVIKKLLDKSPLSYSLFRQYACLDPREMVSHKSKCFTLFKKLLKLLVSYKWVNSAHADIVMSQYERFIDRIPVIGTHPFSRFQPFSESDRVDTFLTSRMDDSFRELKPALKLLLHLSHGQASVERGFSINKEIEVEKCNRRP